MQPNPQTFTPRDSWPPGTVIKDDYVIEARIGKGGFGTVYKAKHRFLQSEHVIKRLHEEYSSDEEYVQKFIAEGQVIRRLKECQFIVAVEHMTLTADQHLILIMEFMPGGDLSKLMDQQRFFTIAEVAGFSAQIGEALRAAHAIELIHRDVKPQNVLLAANKRKAKLTDFGIAADHQNSKATSVVRGGSLGYAAPEQWTTSGRNLDGRTDIYSLGVTMYQMLTQCMPYAAGDIGGWIDAVRSTQPIHANKLREDIPEDINRLVMQMIEVRREHRPPNIESVIDSLRPYADPADWGRSSTLRVPDKTMLSKLNDSPSGSSNPQQNMAPPPPPPPPPLSMQSGPPSNAGYPPPPAQYPPPPSQYPPPPSQYPAPPQQSNERMGYTPTQFQPAQAPEFGSPHPQQQPPTQYPPPSASNQPQPQQPMQYPPPPQYGPSSLPQYNQLPAQPQQPLGYAPPPMQQQPWTPQGPQQQAPPMKKSGGGGKWLVIVPLLLALLGGGGWYGWKMYHPGPKIDDGTNGKKDDGGTTEAGGDSIAKGDEAQKAGDYHKAVEYFRKPPPDAGRIQAVQVLVEAKVQKAVDSFSDLGQYDKADAEVDKWQADFPESEKLKALKEKIQRRRSSQ